MKRFFQGFSWKPIYKGGASSYLFAFALAILWPTVAEGQNVPCGKRDQIVERLSSIYSEKLRARAVTESNWLLELFVSEEGNTWTLIVTSPRGITCPSGAGTGWQFISLKKGEPA